MKIRRGIPVVDGVVIGEAYILDGERFRVTQRFLKAKTTEAADQEWARFQAAAAAARRETEQIQEQISGEVKKEVGSIFGYLAMLYEDPDFPTAGASLSRSGLPCPCPCPTSAALA